MTEAEELLEAALSGAIIAQNGHMTRRGEIYFGSSGTLNIELLAQTLAAGFGFTTETAFRYTHKSTGRSTILTDLPDIQAARKIASEAHDLTEVNRLVTAWETAE